MGRLDDKRIAFLVANSGVEQPELVQPWDDLGSAGAHTTLVAPEAGEVQMFTNDVEKADVFDGAIAVSDAHVDAFDALVLPGGTTNADQLRLDKDAVALVTAFAEAGKPIAAICHGPWALVEAGVLEGRTLTSFPSLQTDVRNAGATWVDEEACTDDSGAWTLVTSRNPDDLDAFVAAATDAFAD